MDLFYTSLILFSVLALHYIYFIGSIFIGLKKLNRSRFNDGSDYDEIVPNLKVTVIIPFRNEAEVILRNLKSIENVIYPQELLEVLYVDDNSEDNSFELLNKNITQTNIKAVKLPQSVEEKANKKQAVEYGISIAKGDIIIATDADCTYGKDWVTSMVKVFNENTGFVAGPVDFETTDSTLSNIQQIEHAGLILTGAGLIGYKNPIICSGANIAFRKKLFDELKGYSGYLDLASGDDSFLMTKVFYDSDYTVDFCFNKNAMVQTRANKNIDEFLNQRKRWVGKAFFYKNKKILLHVVLLSLFLVSLPIQLIIGLVFNSIFIFSFLASFFLKGIVEFLVVNYGAKTIYSKNMMKWFFISELIHIPYTVVTLILGFFSRFNWKGRSLRR